MCTPHQRQSMGETNRSPPLVSLTPRLPTCVCIYMSCTPQSGKPGKRLPDTHIVHDGTSSLATERKDYAELQVHASYVCPFIHTTTQRTSKQQSRSQIQYIISYTRYTSRGNNAIIRVRLRPHLQYLEQYHTYHTKKKKTNTCHKKLYRPFRGG